MVSMKDVAQKIGLSRCTVSNILNNKLIGKSYRPETIELVLRTAREMGYVANNIAKSLKTGCTGTIAIIVPDIANTFYIKIIKEVERLANAADFSLMICIAEEKLEKEEEALTMLQSRRVDGVMISPVSYEESLSRSYSYPVVCFDRTVKKGRHPTVLIDNESSAESLTAALLKKARSAPIFMGQSRHDFTVASRLAGYRKALSRKGLRFNPERVIYDIYDNATAHRVTADLIDRGVGFDSIFLSSNYYVYGVLQALKEKGKAVSSMGGFEEFVGQTLLGEDMAVVDQREEDIGKAAFESLQTLMRGGKSADVIIKTRLQKI